MWACILGVDSDENFSIERWRLVGVAFYESPRIGDDRFVRFHFKESVYEVASRELEAVG